MSRSTRKPFYYRVCCGPVQTDRQIAARTVRHRQKSELHNSVKFADFDEVMLSHRYECSHNDRGSWNCDGKAIYKSPKPSRLHLTFVGIYALSELSEGNNRLDYYLKRIEQDRAWHEELKRK